MEKTQILQILNCDSTPNVTQTIFNKISKVTKLKLQQICDKSIIVTISNYDKTQNVKKKLNYEENKKK